MGKRFNVTDELKASAKIGENDEAILTERQKLSDMVW
jgi:hypothetical protein